MSDAIHAHALEQVNELNFDDIVMKSELPVFIDVSTAWCPPCKVAAPLVAALAKRHAGKLKVVEIDGDASPELTARLGVRGFPTFLGFFGGKVVDSKLGFAGAKPLEALAETLLGAARER